MHRQIQISEGVYITDFRNNAELKGLEQQTNVEVKDLGLLLDQIQACEIKIEKLLESISMIKQEEEWEKEQAFLEAIEENYPIIFNFTGEMKEKIIKVYSINYKPENEKIQRLLDVNRITQRQNRIKEEYSAFLSEFYPQKLAGKQTEEKQEEEDNDEGEGVYV